MFRNKPIAPFIFFLSFCLVLIAGCKKNRNKAPPPDITPPQVSIANPATNNATVSGIVSIQVNALDNKGVSKVEFYIGNILKSTDSSSPYVYAWDTAGVANGPCAIVVIASDTSSNRSTAQINVNVANMPASSPRIISLNPQDRAIFNEGEIISIAANVNSDAANVEYQFSIDGAAKQG